MDALTPAQVLAAVPDAVLSHEEAARQWGIELLSDEGVRRITVPRNFSHVVVAGWRVRRCDIGDPVVLPDGTRVTPAALTVLDLARVLPFQDAVVAGDSALRKKLVTAAVIANLAGAVNGRGRREILAVARAMDPQSGSVLESLFRVLVLTAGLPMPRTQVSIADGRDVAARVDFCWELQRLIVEVDGFAFHSDRASYRRDRQKMNALERLGWRVLRFTYEDVVHRPAHVVNLVRHCLSLGT